MSHQEMVTFLGHQPSFLAVWQLKIETKSYFVCQRIVKKTQNVPIFSIAQFYLENFDEFIT